MFELDMKMFEEAFDSRWAKESNFVGILVDINGVKEVIINSKENYQTKLEYYKKAYNENLTHKHDTKVKIIDFTFAVNYDAIQEELLNP